MKNLEIVIPTFNRAQHLYRTLAALKASPFSECRVIVIDNASTDNTRQVVEFFPGIAYTRNPKNIGAELNYCRAVEISKGPYVWILGDDDAYCWEYGMPVSQAMLDFIIAGDVDMIMPGVTFDGIKTTGNHALTDLIGNERIFFALGFAPALIFKRERYLNGLLKWARILSTEGNLLPMMPFVDAMMTTRASVFIPEIKHIDKGLRHGYSSVKAATDWARIAHHLTYGEPMMREMFGWPACVSNIVGSALCDQSTGRVSRFAELCRDVPRANLFWPAVLIPDWARKIARGVLALSEYDGDRGVTSEVESVKARFEYNYYAK